MTDTENGFKWVHVRDKEELKRFYLSKLPAIRSIAHQMGYAIGVHGSMERDLDLIAAPWEPWHGCADTLAFAIQKAACGIGSTSYQWEEKPCGRVATAFPVCWPEFGENKILSLGCIDLSVMPGQGTANPKRV